ncbi:WD40-repeat-containing domain protein [Zopfochytrium polystomum]|nr:WD40-repeat-containing domain protein [Zopfochytrium polystomum]
MLDRNRRNRDDPDIHSLDRGIPASDRLSCLPPEIAHRVLSLVADARSLARLSCASKQWSSVASRDAYWRPLFHSRWRSPRMRAAPSQAGRNDAPGAANAGRSSEAAGSPWQIEEVAWNKLYEYRHALERRWTSGQPERREFPLRPGEEISCLHKSLIVTSYSTGYTVLRRSDFSTVLTLPVALTPHVCLESEINADGTAILAAVSNETVQLWDLRTGESKAVLNGHQGTINSFGWIDSFIFSVDCREAKLWDAATGVLLHTIDSQPLGICIWNTDGHRLFSLSTDSRIRIWNPATGRCERVLVQCYPNAARTVYGRLLADHTYVVTSWRSLETSVWDVETGNLVSRIRGEGLAYRFPLGMNSVGLFTSGKELIHLWDIATGRNIRSFEAPMDLLLDCTAICFADETKQVGVILDFGSGIPYADYF